MARVAEFYELAGNPVVLTTDGAEISVQEHAWRTYRNGQAQKCTFYHLKSAKTIDSAIYAALDEKKDFDDKLTDVKEANWLEIMGA